MVSLTYNIIVNSTVIKLSVSIQNNACVPIVAILKYFNFYVCHDRVNYYNLKMLINCIKIKKAKAWRQEMFLILKFDNNK